MSAAVAENRLSNNGALAVKPQRLIVEDDSPVAFIMDTARFEHTQRISTLMAACAFMPDHLVKDKNAAVANCTLVLSQALRWQMDPFAIAPETYVVGGKLSYQGKLIAAVVNARAKLSRSLDAVYSNGKGDALAAVVYGSREPIPKEAKEHLVKYVNEDDMNAVTELKFMGIMAIRVSVGQCKTSNKMWTADPQQKLFYTGATKWARRFCPELMLGVITDEDIERMSHQGGSVAAIPAESSPRTLEELNKAMEPAATIAITEPVIPVADEPVVDVQPVQGNPIHPAWVDAIYSRIEMANKTSLLDPIGEELIADMRDESVPAPDKAEYYPLLLRTWAEAASQITKAADKPRVKANIEGWGKFLPAAVHTEMLKAFNLPF